LNVYFLLFKIFGQLALALKPEFALKFFKPGGAAALPASYAYDASCFSDKGLRWPYIFLSYSLP